MELSYVQQGEYFFPKLCFEAENPPIGKYGLLRKSYLKEHKRGWYSSLLLTGKLDAVSEAMRAQLKSVSLQALIDDLQSRLQAEQ